MMPWPQPPSATGATEDPSRPSRALDRGTLLAECAAPDNLLWQDGHLLFTSGRAVLLLDVMSDHGREPEEILRFESEVTAMAAASDGSLAVGLGTGGIAIVGGEHDGTLLPAIGLATRPTALCFADPQTLLVGLGSRASTGGALWRFDLRRAAPACLAEQAGDPSGLLLPDGDRLILADASRRRLIAVSAGRPADAQILASDLPGVLGRLAPAAGDGAWLAIPAPQPPWDSGGLVLRLNGNFQPVGSMQARPEGRCRGVASCLEARGELILACREGNVLISVDLS